MEVFWLIVLGGIVVAIGIGRYNKKVNEAWAEAALKLRLNYSGGRGNRRMKGQHSEILLEAKTVSAGKTTLTSYKGDYPETLPFSIRLRPQTFLSNLKSTVLHQIDLELGDPQFDSKVIVESREPAAVREFLDKQARAAVMRLIGRFDDFEMNERGVEVKRSRLISNTVDLVEDFRVLENAVRDIWTSAIPAKGPTPVPPPLPKQIEKEISQEIETETVATQSVVPLPEPRVIEEARNRREVFEVAEEESEAVAPSPPEPDEKVVAEQPIEDPSDSLLAQHIREIFSDCQSRYAMTKQFDTELKGLEIDDRLPLLHVETFSTDRIFGRGPGILRTFSLGRLPDGSELLLVADSDENVTLAGLHPFVGNTAGVVGTLSAFDPFAHTLFLRSRLQE